MKKLFSLLVVSLLALSPLSGCSSKPEAPKEGETEVVTLRIAHNMDFTTIPEAVVDAGARLNERYAQEGKNIRIEFETDYQSIDWTDYHNNVVFAHKSEDAPDIYSLDSDIVGFVKAGTLMDVSDIVTDDFVDGVFSSLTVDGKVYGMPFDLPVRAIYYNKTDLKKIGWTDEEIEALPEKITNKEMTLEQFMALCKEVQDKGGAEYGLAHRPGSGSDFLDVLRSLGGQYYDENGKLVFDEAGVTRFFQLIYDNANTTKITPQNLNQMGWASINKMVGDGSTFAYYGPMYSSVYVAGAVNKTAEQLAEDVAFVMFPVSENSTEPFVVAAPQSMGISTQTKYPEICKDLFKELYTNSTDLLARHANKIFTLSSVKNANEDDLLKSNPILKKVTYMADYTVTEPTVESINIYTTELHNQIVQLELGLIQPADAVKTFKQQLELNLKPEQITFK